MNTIAKDVSSPRHNTVFLGVAFFWSVVIVVLASWNYWQSYTTTVEVAQSTAKESYSKDLVYRRWASSHGGVYAPITPEMPPNPYLSDIPERDISTPSGKRLTLINPSYMTRQVHALGKKDYGMMGHITSLKPIRPENAPDEWEQSALQAFERGRKEVSALEAIGNETYLRFMRPLLTETGCMKCHAKQGYRVGDIRGGISVSLPWAPFRAALRLQLLVIILCYGGIWTIGILGLYLGRKRLQDHLSVRKQSEDALLVLKDTLQDKNDQLLATEEMLREQIREFETSQNLLKESKVYYRAIVDAYDGQIYTCSQDYQIEFLNEKMIERIGRNAVGEPCFKALHDLDAICSWCVNDRVFKGETVRWEVQSPKDNRWYYVVNTPLYNENGTMSKQAMIQDITERKQAEEALMVLKNTLQDRNDQLLATDEMLREQISGYETSQKLLKESEERFRTLLENVPCIAVQAYAPDGTVLFWNRASEQLYGFNSEEALGGNLLDLIIPPEMREGVTEAMQQMIESGEPIPAGELLLKRKDGSRVPVFSSHALINPIGKQPELFCLDFDLTESKHAEEEHQKLEHQFHQAQKLESLGVLAGGIAHDFNNILTVIMGYCYMAQNDKIPEQNYKAAFQKIETAGNRATDLCRQMLTYAGKSPMEQTLVNLWLLVDEIVKMLQAAINKNVTIELDLKRGVPEINGDAAQIQQIIMNLIINAADAIGDKNGTIRVILTKMVFEGDQTITDTFGTVIKAGRYACLEVVDTGSGMDEATMKRIFEPFFTTKFTGRGLGMSAIRGIIKSHEGNLQLTSTPGVGTTFKIFFPVPNVSDNAENSATTVSLAEKTGGTILLVEDEETLRVMGKTMLDAMGFSAMTASNGSEALEIYRERVREIDVILMDLIMPVMGGVEAYHELRNISGTVPIIICSGYSVESVEDVIRNDPYAEFVHKPYKPNELRDVMVGMIG